MKKVLINKSLLIEPIPHQTFFQSERQTFEEVGTVLAKDESFTGFWFWKKPVVEIPIGSRVYFQSWMAEKYPNLDKEDSYHWVVPYSEIKMYEYEPKIPKK